MRLKVFWLNVNIIRTLPSLFIYKFSPMKTCIDEDIEAWIKNHDLKYLNYRPWKYFHYLLLFYPEFRNLFYYRIKQKNPILSRIIQIFYPRLSTLYINATSIGSGLFIQHGFCTIIAAKSIGKNCWINQQVTIGFSGRDNCPTIGDNVRIAAGAKVLGKINIGSNCFIAANAAVISDVPDNCLVGGVPAVILKQNGVRIHQNKGA